MAPDAGPAAVGSVDAEGAIDWNAPWLQPWRSRGETVTHHRHTMDAPVHAALNCLGPGTGTAEGKVRFVAADALPPGRPYESHIFATGEIPTRDNLHDFFNGLAWQVFPRTKRHLNRLQAEAIAKAGVGAVRGPLRDTVTVFDENGAVLQAPDVLWDALVSRDWHTLFVVHRSRWAEARLTLFGHALLEKLVSPRKGITAHVLPAPPAIESIAELDAWLAGHLTAARLSTKPFVPLPVLGVPGWWPANGAAGFYDDPQVFRRPRRIE